MGKMMRPKSFPGCTSDEPDLPETDKIKVSKTIADLLMFPINKNAKGAKMFAKRRKRSAKYTIESYGTRPEGEELPQEIGPQATTTPVTAPSGTINLPGMPMVGGGGWGAPPPPPPPLPPPIPPPMNEPVFIPSLGITIAPTDFNINMKKKDKCEHKNVSPLMCGMLVADLKGGLGGKGASMFERRRIRSDKFVLTKDKNNLNDSSEGDEKEPPAAKTVTLEFIARHGQEEKEERQEPIVHPVQPQPSVQIRGKTPWQAAMDSPVGSIDSAFNQVNKKPFKKLTPDRPKPPAAWMATSNMVPQIPATPPSEPRIKPKFKVGVPFENGNSAPAAPTFRPMFDARKSAADNAAYKDFNKKAKGWGGSSSPQYSNDNSPPSASPSSMHSGDFASPGLEATFPQQPLKYGGGYNNFNRSPRSFGSPNGGSSPQAHGQTAMESDEL